MEVEQNSEKKAPLWQRIRTVVLRPFQFLFKKSNQTATEKNNSNITENILSFAQAVWHKPQNLSENKQARNFLLIFQQVPQREYKEMLIDFLSAEVLPAVEKQYLEAVHAFLETEYSKRLEIFKSKVYEILQTTDIQEFDYLLKQENPLRLPDLQTAQIWMSLLAQKAAEADWDTEVKTKIRHLEKLSFWETEVQKAITSYTVKKLHAYQNHSAAVKQRLIAALEKKMHDALSSPSLKTNIQKTDLLSRTRFFFLLLKTLCAAALPQTHAEENPFSSNQAENLPDFTDEDFQFFTLDTTQAEHKTDKSVPDTQNKSRQNNSDKNNRNPETRSAPSMHPKNTLEADPEEFIRWINEQNDALSKGKAMTSCLFDSRFKKDFFEILPYLDERALGRFIGVIHSKAKWIDAQLGKKHSLNFVDGLIQWFAANGLEQSINAQVLLNIRSNLELDYKAWTNKLDNLHKQLETQKHPKDKINRILEMIEDPAFHGIWGVMEHQKLLLIRDHFSELFTKELPLDTQRILIGQLLANPSLLDQFDPELYKKIKRRKKEIEDLDEANKTNPAAFMDSFNVLLDTLINQPEETSQKMKQVLENEIEESALQDQQKEYLMQPDDALLTSLGKSFYSSLSIPNEELFAQMEQFCKTIEDASAQKKMQEILSIVRYLKKLGSDEMRLAAIGVWQQNNIYASKPYVLEFLSSMVQELSNRIQQNQGLLAGIFLSLRTLDNKNMTKTKAEKNKIKISYLEECIENPQYKTIKSKLYNIIQGIKDEPKEITESWIQNKMSLLSKEKGIPECVHWLQVHENSQDCSGSVLSKIQTYKEYFLDMQEEQIQQFKEKEEQAVLEKTKAQRNNANIPIYPHIIALCQTVLKQKGKAQRQKIIRHQIESENQTIDKSLLELLFYLMSTDTDDPQPEVRLSVLCNRSLLSFEDKKNYLALLAHPVFYKDQNGNSNSLPQELSLSPEAIAESAVYCWAFRKKGTRSLQQRIEAIKSLKESGSWGETVTLKTDNGEEKQIDYKEAFAIQDSTIQSVIQRLEKIQQERIEQRKQEEIQLLQNAKTLMDQSLRLSGFLNAADVDPLASNRSAASETAKNADQVSDSSVITTIKDNKQPMPESNPQKIMVQEKQNDAAMPAESILDPFAWLKEKKSALEGVKEQEERNKLFEKWHQTYQKNKTAIEQEVETEIKHICDDTPIPLQKKQSAEVQSVKTAEKHGTENTENKSVWMVTEILEHLSQCEALEVPGIIRTSILPAWLKIGTKQAAMLLKNLNENIFMPALRSAAVDLDNAIQFYKLPSESMPYLKKITDGLCNISKTIRFKETQKVQALIEAQGGKLSGILMYLLTLTENPTERLLVSFNKMKVNVKKASSDLTKKLMEIERLLTIAEQKTQHEMEQVLKGVDEYFGQDAQRVVQLIQKANQWAQKNQSHLKNSNTAALVSPNGKQQNQDSALTAADSVLSNAFMRVPDYIQNAMNKTEFGLSKESLLGLIQKNNPKLAPNQQIRLLEDLQKNHLLFSYPEKNKWLFFGSGKIWNFAIDLNNLFDRKEFKKNLETYLAGFADADEKYRFCGIGGATSEEKAQNLHRLLEKLSNDQTLHEKRPPKKTALPGVQGAPALGKPLETREQNTKAKPKKSETQTENSGAAKTAAVKKQESKKPLAGLNELRNKIISQTAPAITNTMLYLLKSADAVFLFDFMRRYILPNNAAQSNNAKADLTNFLSGPGKSQHAHLDQIFHNDPELKHMLRFDWKRVKEACLKRAQKLKIDPKEFERKAAIKNPAKKL